MQKFLNIIIGFLVITFIACIPQRSTVLVSKDNHQNIRNWIQSINKNLTIKECYSLSKDSINYYLTLANGVILGGGEDVNPLLYDKPEYRLLCEKPNNYRDTLELALIAHAMQNNIPVLGICRGLQILNVANGGTLIPDIPTFYNNSKILHRSRKDKAHKIIALGKSWLPRRIKRKPHWVNSRHHQCIDEVADRFKVVAISPDSVIESIELINTNNHPFATAVQWHPESITKDKLSKILGKKFLKKVKKYKLNYDK